MQEYLQITSGDKLMFYPEFRIAEMTVMPWYDGKTRLDIELGTFDGAFNPAQKLAFETDLKSPIENAFSNISLRLECGLSPINNLEQVKFKIANGGDEDQGGLIQLCIDWVIYLHNVSIEFVSVGEQLYTVWRAESEEIDSYSISGLTTKYELVAKIKKLSHLENYQELLSHSKAIVKREGRYRNIISKLKGNLIQNELTKSIMPLQREFEYNDSIWAWNKTVESIGENEQGQ